MRPRRRLGIPLKRDDVASLVREMIADGTLKPGGAAPSGAALAEKTGYSSLTCRAALRLLLTLSCLADGGSMPGPEGGGCGGDRGVLITRIVE